VRSGVCYPGSERPPLGVGADLSKTGIGRRKGESRRGVKPDRAAALLEVLKNTLATLPHDRLDDGGPL